jgi:hypothetical protein
MYAVSLSSRLPLIVLANRRLWNTRKGSFVRQWFELPLRGLVGNLETLQAKQAMQFLGRVPEKPSSFAVRFRS